MMACGRLEGPDSGLERPGGVGRRPAAAWKAGETWTVAGEAGWWRVGWPEGLDGGGRLPEGLNGGGG